MNESASAKAIDRVTKPRILEAVRAAKGEPAVQLIDYLKKGDMAREAEQRGKRGNPLTLIRVMPERGRECFENHLPCAEHLPSL